MAEATVKDSLLGVATISAYLVKASVMQRVYFFLVSVLRGPNKLA